jgi:hypothetical protein
MSEMDERDEVTIRLVALVDEMTFAAARRVALSERAAQIRADEPWIADAVEAVLRYRRRRSNVLPMRKRGGA